MEKLERLFIDADSMAAFMHRYFDMYETPNLEPDELDLFGWDAVAEDISCQLWQRIYEIGDYVEIEIRGMYTKTGNPELITVGQLVEKPVEEFFSFDAEDIHFIGDYKLNN